MRVLFVHQNAPGQFRHLAPHLARRPGWQVAVLGQSKWETASPLQIFSYESPPPPRAETHRYLRKAESCVRRGQTVARACLKFAERGFTPDLVIGHPGWGELLFLRDVLPRAKILSYCELFYRPEGQDTGYVPETAIDLDGRCRLRTWNADLLAGLNLMDRGLTPTFWQRDQHPAIYRPLIEVIHEGVDLREVAPDPAARFTVPDGPTFQAGDELVTYVARDLEPVRGFPQLMRTLPGLLRRRPAAQVVICGGDGISYGRPPPCGTTWREAMLRDVPVDPTRVHFVGKLPRAAYLDLLRVSALHLYLSVPFVLSWSCIEALGAGCLVLGSDVTPVREVIEEGVNGFLVDVRETEILSGRAADLLARRAELLPLRRAARESVRARFELGHCLAAQAHLVDSLLQ